jgi:methionyl-tRNA formyltransferase
VLNCHGGLLPRYRGYHGNGWAFINGEAEIGYTIHRVDATLDGGPIVYQSRVAVTEDTTFGELKARLMDDLVERLPGVLRAYLDGALAERPQDIRDATFVARRHPRDCYIEWDEPSAQIERFVRALAPPAAPGAFTVFRDKKLVIRSADVYATAPYREIPGHVVYRIEDRGVLVKTGDGVLLVKEVEYDGAILAALDLFPTMGYRLGLDLVGERLASLGIT